jgi:uncharacterized membrane protein YoaK (UPF0700 family)
MLPFKTLFLAVDSRVLRLTTPLALGVVCGALMLTPGLRWLAEVDGRARAVRLFLVLAGMVIGAAAGLMVLISFGAQQAMFCAAGVSVCLWAAADLVPRLSRERRP